MIKTKFAALVLAGAVVFGACSKDSNTTDAAATEATTEAEAAASTEAPAADTTPAATEAPAADTTPAAAGTEAAALKDIVDTAVGAGNFTTLAKLLGDAGLVETLKGPGPFTVFAPTDEAFAKVPADVLAGLAADKAKLAQVLTYHVVAGKVMAADVKTGEARSVAGPSLKLMAEGGKVMVNDANVTAADIVASNGVIHVIDTVLLPPA